MKMNSFVAFITFGWLGIICPKLFAGHDVRNGGDTFVMSIQRTAQELVDKWSALTPECAGKLKLTAKQFQELLDHADIQTTPDPIYLEIDGKKVFKEAWNDPNTKIIMFHRDSYLHSAHQEQLLIHEFLGLAHIPDPKYRESGLAVDLLKDPNCQTPQSEKPLPISGDFPDDFLPLATVVDRNRILYLIDSKYDRVFRYDLKNEKTMPPLVLAHKPKSMSYSRFLNRLYVEKESSRISYFALADGAPTEVNFAQIRGPISGMVAMRDNVLIVPQGGSWVHHLIYDREGNVAQEKDMSYIGTSFVYEPHLDAVFFISGFSPRDLHRLSFLKGKITKDKDSPYHGDFSMNGPLTASSSLIAMGSGHIFRTSDLARIAQLPDEFQHGVWIGGRLVVARREGSGFIVQSHDDKLFEDHSERFEGIIVSLEQDNQDIVIVAIDGANKVQILKRDWLRK